MTYDIVCSETQSEKAIQHLGVLILLWRRHYHITQQELAKRTGLLPVSYTHLTLPTILLV